jgi:Holliday junction resolvasome RuvABC endonuclease subunit
MSTTVLAVDPASCTGWALFDVSDEHIHIREFGAIEVDKGAESEGAKMLSLRVQIAHVLDKLTERPYHAHIESFFFNRRTCNGSEVNVVLRAAIYQLLTERGITYSLHPPTHWKKFIGGTAVPRKADIQKFGKAKAGKAYIVQALADKFEIHFPSHTRIGNRRLTFKTDISDAVGIGIYGILTQFPQLRVVPHDAREPVLNLSARASTPP